MQAVLRAVRFVAIVFVFGGAGASLYAQEPLDLFADQPKHAEGFIRIACWNLRHINLEANADDLLVGDTEAEDFAILTATFAKAIDDLALDLVVIVEHQPRANEPDRLAEILGHVNAGGAAEWRMDSTQIPYDNTSSQFGNLQFAVLWRSDRVTIDTTADTLLEQLRQPRNADGTLVHRRLRAPWLIPIAAGELRADLIAVHLKSGGEAPQRDEIDAITGYLRERLTGESPRHTILLGDWNIRPDQSSGRLRLRDLMVPNAGSNLMRVLTVENIPPDLDGWDMLEDAGVVRSLPGVIPFTHFNANTLDTFLDHIAISSTLDEAFGHPITVLLEDGSTDIRPGIEIAYPQVPEAVYSQLTDHLPVIVTLRTGGVASPAQPGVLTLDITAATPNPIGSDYDGESVRLTNRSAVTISLYGWQIGDSTPEQTWSLTSGDGVIGPGQSVTVIRGGRNMALNNNGDTIRLINPVGQVIDTETYDSAASGQVIMFE